MVTLHARSVSLVSVIISVLCSTACGSAAPDGNEPALPSPSAPEGSHRAVPRASELAVQNRATGVAPQDPTPPRPTTKEACDACEGLWEIHGIVPEETCLCKTNDQGSECTDGNDCQGECLLDDNAEFRVMQHDDPPRGHYTGRCAGYDTTFGCFRHIPGDIQGQLPLTAEEASQFICVD
jgi:hypothetical protein